MVSTPERDKHESEISCRRYPTAEWTERAILLLIIMRAPGWRAACNSLTPSDFTLGKYDLHGRLFDYLRRSQGRSYEATLRGLVCEATKKKARCFGVAKLSVWCAELCGSGVNYRNLGEYIKTLKAVRQFRKEIWRRERELVEAWQAWDNYVAERNRNGKR